MDQETRSRYGFSLLTIAVVIAAGQFAIEFFSWLGWKPPQSWQSWLNLPVFQITRLRLIVAVISIVITVVVLKVKDVALNDGPHIAKVSSLVESLMPSIGYPLKIRVTMRNDSAQCADVRISEFIENKVSVKQPFVTKVLQLDLSGKWLPEMMGEERIAVLPGHSFRAWVGVDDKLFTKEQVEQHIGQIGTIVLLVNRQSVNVAL